MQCLPSYVNESTSRSNRFSLTSRYCETFLPATTIETQRHNRLVNEWDSSCSAWGTLERRSRGSSLHVAAKDAEPPALPKLRSRHSTEQLRDGPLRMGLPDIGFHRVRANTTFGVLIESQVVTTLPDCVRSLAQMSAGITCCTDSYVAANPASSS